MMNGQMIIHELERPELENVLSESEMGQARPNQFFSESADLNNLFFMI